MKKTFLILLVLLCVATMAVASASAAENMVSDDLGAIDLDDNAIEPVSSTESDFSTSDNLAIDDSSESISDDSGTNDKSLEAAPLKDGETTIYVSTTGDDSNDGLSEANSVATVGKAVEIVNSSTGTDFKIFVKNGNYNIQKIDSPAAKNVRLIGESKEGAILHASGTYGINIYEDNISWNIENLTICDLNDTAGTSAAIRFYSDTPSSMNNCILRNITAKNGAILFNNEGTTTISNTIIEDCYGATSSGSCIISVTGDGVLNLDNIEIHGCSLDETIAGTSTAYYLRAILYINTYGATVNLMNSRITENAGPMGALLESRAKLNVLNTTISDNYINSSTNTVNGGDIIIWASHDNSKINISQSVIARNTLARSNNGVFYAQKGTTNVEYSAIYDNKLANGNNADLISGSLITADNNYWGTNERPNSKVNNWVILTADVPEYAFVGVAESIPVYLNTYNNTAGETGSITGMPDVSLGVAYTLNTENPATVTISNGQGAIDYTASLDGDETITLSTGDAFSFEVNADVSTLIYVDGSVATTGTGTSESPFKTIAEALNIAADGKIIVIRSGTYEESDLVIDDAITIKADKGATVTIDAGNEGRVFTVSSTATLRDLSLTGGMTNDLGGAIYLNGGNLTLNNVNISDCGAGKGGAIGTTAGSSLTVTNSKFSENIAMYGGAIYVAGEADIRESKFADHEYTTYGGGIYLNTTSPVSISSNTFTGNDADKGEAIYVEDGSPVLSGNAMGDETIYLAGGSLKTILTFIGGNTVNADFGENVTLTATLLSEDGNTVKGGTVTFTANGETIATISGNNALQTTYIVPPDATGDITISGSYSLDNAGTVVSGILHPAISYWFIEGGSGYETLAQAIDAASAGDVIYYDLADDYTEVINGKTISKNLVIKNNGTGAVTLDADKSKVFTVSANLELNNINFINGASTQGGFISQSSGNINIVDCSFKDSRSTANGAVISTSSGNVNIAGTVFENLTGKEGIIQHTGSSGTLTIANSVFNNITGSYDGWIVSTKTPTSIENTNFTNLVSTQASSSSYYGAVYNTKDMNVTGCYFANITGPKGAAIYAMGSLNVTRSVFDNIVSNFSIIFASNANSYVNYNIFVNNGNAKKFIESSIADVNYNFWGSNEKPNSTVVGSSLYKNWTIVDLSCASEIVYMGTTADINVQFLGTDGTDALTLEGLMPDYTFDLSASSGTIPSSVTVEDNEAIVEFAPTSEGTVTITAAPGPASLELNVMDTSALLVVSTDGSNSNPGTLDSPYATIAYALSQVTETRNIIYLLDKAESYTESDLTVSGNVIIRGEDNAIVIDAENGGRIFTVTGTLVLEDVILTNGMTNENGGAILVNGGNLTLNNVAINECGASSGGAIATTAGSNLTVNNSVFGENIAIYGGAIYTESEAAISNSEFNGHAMPTYGGAIYVNTTSDVSISSNTFEDNDADKGEAIYIENGAVNLSENTFEDAETIYLKGGSVNGVLIFLANSTVNADFGETVTLTATLTDDKGNSIVGGNVVFTANGETVATVANSGSALETSYVVPSDASSDILISGSFSLDNGGVVATGVVHPAISYWFIEGGSGYETLAEAVAAASAGDVIYGAPGTYTVSGVNINKAITIKANESGAIVLDGGASKIFTTSADVTLINLTLTNGATTGNGGLIAMSSGSLNVYNSTFKDTIMSTSSTQGAAIYGYGNVLISGSEFRNLTARQGAAIWQQSSGASVTIEDSVFDNISGTYDGALIKLNGPSSIKGSNFTNIAGAPTSTEYGNIYSGSGNLTVEGCNFINMTGPQGAAIYFTSNSGSVLNITKSVFDNITCLSKGIIYSTKTSYINYNVFINVNEGINITTNYLGNGNVNYNYWGTNENISSTIKTYALNNWVVMTVTPDTLDSVLSGETQTFTVDFTHYTDGTANYTLADTIPELTVSASALKGDLDQAAIETVNGMAVFTYTASQDGEETVTFTNANVAIPVSFAVGNTYMGTIYVSKDGDDENMGSQDAPVASIAKAVELAQAGSGKIIVNEGTYAVKAVNITEDLEISTEGDVIFDGDGTRALWIQSGDVSISGITFTNCLEQYSGSAIRVSGGSLDIDGCKFIDNGGANARDSIINVKNAALTVNNTLFENNTAHATSTSYSVIYTSAATLVVDNTQFIDNKLKYGAIYATGTIAVINNTLFQGFDSVSSSGGSGCGIYAGGTSAYQYSNGTVRPGEASYVLVENCDFINNKANGGTYYSGQGAAIYVNNNATVIVKDSSFINNTCMDNTGGDVTGKGGAIFASAGSVTVMNSVFENNVASEGSEIYMKAYGPDTTTLNFLNVTNCIIRDNGESVIVSNYTNGTLVANSNWWGTNAGAEGKVSEGITVDNWVIMNVDPSIVDGAITGKPVEISIDFKHTNSTDGTIAALEGTLPEEFTVYGGVVNGTISQSPVTTEGLEAKLVYTPEFAGENVVNVYTDEFNTVPIIVNAEEPYVGPIYVSKDGDDSNSGKEDSPVATIAKAVELAKEASGQIIINEGTYTENGIVINDDLEISTVGEVILDGNGARYFDIKSGDVSIANVTITNCNNTYGGAVIRVTGGSLTIADSLIVANGGEYRDNLIRVTGASLTLNNTVFENNTAHATSTSYGGVYISDGVLIVDGCTFKDNFNKYGQIYVTGSSYGSVAVINNTQFIGNNATSASGGTGAAIYLGGTAAYQYSNGTVRPGAPSTVYVVGCEFINNSAKGANYYAGQGGAIYVNNNATLYVSDSRFINNTCVDNNNGTIKSNGGAIYSSAGNVNIANSVFENNVASEGSEIYMKAYGPDTTNLNYLNISNSIIRDDGDSVIVSNYTNGTLLANNNWWGSNDNPADKVSEGITVDKWVIFNVDPTYVPITEAQDVEITIDFVHVTDAEGTISELEGTLPEEFTVNAMTMTGTLNATTVTTVDGIAKVTFTPEESGESVAYIVFGQMNVPVTVEIVEPYVGPIYVATNGNDENLGSPDAPVASIAKAIELAQAGTGQVIIKEGTYPENNITINSEIPLSIAGEGNVVIDGTDLNAASVFIIKTSQAISIANITFANNKARYGGAINAVGSRNALMEVDIIIDNCVFDNLKGTSSSRGGAIYGEYLDGSIVINNSVFTNCNSSGWGGAVAITYSAYEDGLDLVINNTSFDNNRGNNGGAGYLMANTITIENSNFTQNSAIYYPGALELYNCTATIDNCIFANNSAKSQGTAIKLEAVTNQPIATLSITNSIIEDNYGSEGIAPAIFVDKGTLDISYSSIVNEHNLETKTATGYDAIYGQGIAIANNNWWGTDDPTTTVNGTNITIDKWVILNVEANATDVVAGDEVKVTVDFNHVMTAAGEIEELTGGVIPKETYTVSFAVENGTIAPESVVVANGESAEAIFTAENDFALITATSENAVASIVFEGEIPEPFTGIVYVSKDGDDANNGSEEAPVSSIARAVEIATAEFGSGQIIINEGTYNEHDFNITKDLTITGVGDVVIDAEGLGRLFYMSYGAEVGKFALSNLVLTGAKFNYGAVIYSFAKETELNNVTITGINETGDLITSYGNLTIKDSQISDNNAGDIIQASGDADIVLNNTLFNDNEVTASTADYGIVYISSGKGNLIVDDCAFYNNTARQGVLIGNSYTNITVINSLFLENNNTVAYGGVIRALSKLDVTDSIFMDNAVGREGGAIYVGSNGNATITKSAFINNTCGHFDSDYNGDAISSYGKLTVNYCILLPAEGSSKVLIFNGNEDETPNAQYNWWGTNDNPANLVAGDSYYDSWDGDIDCPAPDVSNWIIMNVEYDIGDVEVGAALPITVDFKHYLDANGEVQELADSLAQELVVDFISATGTFDNNEVTTVGQVATGTYTIAEGANSITVKSSDASVAIEFEATTSIETNVAVSADSVWIGNPVNVLINVTDSEGNAVEGTVTLKFGDIEETLDLSEGIAAYTIPVEKLTAGVNTVNVAYNNVTPYTASEGTSTFMVLDGVVTKDTFQYYFDGENNYTLFGYVPEGATLDFQGDFLGAYTTNINKPVNIVSTTGDAFIETNKTGSFNILAGGSGTNVTGLKFLNTAFYITTAHDVTIDNIHMVANMNGVGSSTGFLSIRSNSSYVTVKNSYFENGGTGSSCLVIGKSSYCVIDHNVINATKNSGNIIYITTYVGTGDTPCYNNITNNVIESKVNSGFCYAIAVIGAYNLIENNTVNHPGSGIVQQSTWGAAPQPSGHNSYINNTLTGGCGLTAMVNSTVLDNNVAGAMTLNADCTAEGNTANTLTVSGANCIVKGNTINGAVTVAAAAKGTEMTGNTITGLVTVNSGENTITANDIRTSSEYAIDLKTGANNTVTDNTLYASEKVGDAAVKFTEGKDNLVQYNLPLSTELTVVVDDAIVGESSNINIKLVDAKGNSVSGIVKVTIGEDEYNVTVTDGKGSVSIAPFAQTGTYDVVASFNDEAYAPAAVETSVTVYGPGNVTVKHTDAGDAHDIQAAIDAANPGDVVQLGNYSYTDVADVNITKPVTLAGTEGTTITSTGDGTPIFNVPAISENGPESVNITGIDFKLANGDTVVKATADNDTNPLSIVTPSINIKENTFELVNETTVGESVTILELESERGILSPTGEISISGNEITAGINPFEFDVTSVGSGNDVNITPQNLTPVKKATRIIYKDMVTTAVDMGLDGRVGEWFNFTLVDEDGTPIPNTPMEIGFNGKIYNSENEGIITDENGTARLQINLGSAGSNTFAISFLGNDEYDASFAVARINVTAQKGTLTVPNKSYSASAKTKSLTATLKSASGKAVRNKEIVFIVDGKYYSAKTNANGVATVKVSLNKKGTYKFSVMFNHDVRYAPINKTATLTIK